MDFVENNPDALTNNDQSNTSDKVAVKALDQGFIEEQSRIFKNTWVPVCHESELPDPYDFRTSSIGNENVIICRAPDGKVNALLNVCPHRGMLIERRPQGSFLEGQASGNPKRITCMFHAWQFDMRGNCVYVAREKEGYQDRFCKDDAGLRRLRCEVNYGGFVWVNMNDQPAVFLEEWAGAAFSAIAPQICSEPLEVVHYHKEVVDTGYQQLMIRFDTGIILHPGGNHGRAHVGVVGGMSVGDTYYTTKYNNGMIVEGNVGIGTTSPGAKLQITKAQSDGVSSGEHAHLYLSNSSHQNTTGRTSIFLHTSTTNSSKYGISLSGDRTGTSGTPTFTIRGHSNSDAGTELLTVKNNGSVGIGTSDPQCRLHTYVNGDNYTRIQSSTGTQAALEFYRHDLSGNEHQIQCECNAQCLHR